MFFGRSDHCHQWFYDGFLMLLPSLSMVFDGSGPLVKRCDGFDESLWSILRYPEVCIDTCINAYLRIRVCGILEMCGMFEYLDKIPQDRYFGISVIEIYFTTQKLKRTVYLKPNFVRILTNRTPQHISTGILHFFGCLSTLKDPPVLNRLSISTFHYVNASG